MEVTEAESVFADATEKMKRADWTGAVQEFQKAVGLGYRSATVPFYLGEALVRSARYEEAVKAYEEGVADDPWLIWGSSRAYPHYFLGAALILANRAQEAVHHLQEALRIRADLVEAQGALGIALNSLGRLAESRQAFAAALALLPRYLEHWPVAFEGAFFFKVRTVREIYESVSRGEQWRPSESRAAEQGDEADEA